jgi:hypothetical protein
MEAAPLELVEGHVHQAWDNAFTSLLQVWPTPRAGYWHVWMRGPQSHATKEPVPSDLLFGRRVENLAGQSTADQPRPPSVADDPPAVRAEAEAGLPPLVRRPIRAFTWDASHAGHGHSFRGGGGQPRGAE